jgi:hypothetical protein
MRGFAREVVNGLTNPEGLEGIRLKVLPAADMVRLAKASKQFNRVNYPELMAEFGETAAPTGATAKK